MEFCKKCGSVIMGKTCVSCGNVCEKEICLESSEKIEGKREIAVVNEGDHDVNPIIEMACPKCKHNEAYFWTKQTRASDEAETRFYKCVKCKHTWRIYR